MGNRGRAKRRSRVATKKRSEPILLALAQPDEKRAARPKGGQRPAAPEPAPAKTPPEEPPAPPRPERARPAKKVGLLQKLFGSRKPERPRAARKPVADEPEASSEALPEQLEPLEELEELPEVATLEQELEELEEYEPLPLPDPVEAPPAPRQEASKSLTDGLRRLSQLLHGVNERMDEQGERSAALSARFTDVPAMARAQVDFLATLADQLTEQKDKSTELMSKLGGLPDLLQGIHKSLERQTAVETRTERNLSDFRATMDNIHTSIGQLTQESRTAVQEATESFEGSHARTTQAFEATQRQAYETFAQTQSAQLTQFARMVERSTRMSRGIIILLVTVCASLAVLFAIALAR